MIRVTRTPRRYQIVLSYDCCNFEPLTREIPTMLDVKRTFRELQRMGYRLENLHLKDLDTGRLVSWVL